ncbi:hypothetical protein Poly24_01170 [Rosistilla carotiformis]|uniref:DUF1501 domain-containing protein n=1 Tax=Rosistilla carotiformis TaxID=2528017 RepID=A0A518JLK6_9BACT|nr:DUF1501 domain-containing protein [Rosistilla carotiformis]QDV66431.1 hypothetical protein Poly24_01170 [Rosistilla carotiformis]
MSSAKSRLGATRCCGPVSRRSFLEFGGVAGVSGLGLGNLLQAREATAASVGRTPQDTSVIFVWLPGGPPHMETYDMKPDAPSDYRGLFSPIKTNVPGLDVSELLPMHAKIADKFSLIRSIHHDFADHGGGHKRFLTGRDPAKPTGFVNDSPCVGSMASLDLEHRRQTGGLPNYVVLGSGRVNNVDTFSFGSAYLGNHTHPFRISTDPNKDDFQVPNISIDQSMSDRLSDRVGLLQQIDNLRREIDYQSSMHSMDSFRQKAVQMLTSTRVREAFDMSQESDSVRDRFGRHGWGQRALLARRLVERGVPWVTVVMENPYQSGISMPQYGTYNWDSHAVNCHLFDDAKIRLPIYDNTITAMIEDLYARGLDRKVLLVVTGEFGRTPRISQQVGSKTKISQPGRDHWPRAMSMLVSGGGLRTGQVIGATNNKGEEPIHRAMSPNDLWATVYRHLGIDYTQSFLDHSGRPMPMLPFGEPIPELI